MQAVILAGGAGTRLASVTGNLPKALVDVEGVPLLGRQLELLADQGFRDVVVLSGHRANPDAEARADQISAYCGNGDAWGLTLRCNEEPAAMGTAGAVLDAIATFHEEFVILYGDTVMDVDLSRLVAAHHTAQPAATVFIHPNDHPYDSDLVEVDELGRVIAFHPKPRAKDTELPNLVNAALYVLNRDAVRRVDNLPPRPDFAHHVFPRMLELGLRVQGYKSPEYIKDAGTPSRIEKVRRDLKSGLLAQRSLRTRSAAVFLDRDGVINQERGLISRPQDLDLVPGAATAVRRLNESRFRTICVTNQPIIARGDASVAELGRIHARLETLLGHDGAYLDDIFFCPHHPDAGFAGEIRELKIICDCRKPATALVERAAMMYNLDLAESWMIGDRTADIELARRSGMRSILVQTGHAGKDGGYDVEPDLVAEDLADAVRLLEQLRPADFLEQPVSQEPQR